MGRYFKNLNSKFFYKIFSIITSLILLCSLSISLSLYYRFDATMTGENKEFIANTSNQVRSDIVNLMKKNEWIAGNIYSDNSIELFLKQNYYQVIDYSLFEMFNFTSSYFRGIEENNPGIADMCLYKLDPGQITDGKSVRDFSSFRRQDLIRKAIGAAGANVWDFYTGDDGKPRLCLLKYLNVYRPGGVLVIELKEENFYDLYKAGAANREVFLTDAAGNIVSSNRRDSVGKNFSKVMNGSLPGKSGTDEVQFNGIRYFFSSVEISPKWHVVTLFNSNEIEREKVRMKWFAGALTGVSIFIGLLFSLFLASGFASQVSNLMGKIREIERGNLKIKPDIKKVNEFHQLDKTLCAMAGNIDRLNSDIVKAVQQKEEIEIKYLQMQMNPHFLYNLLSAIRWIAYRNKEGQIISVVDHLSNFYRIALSKGNEIIELKSEISLIQSYIRLQNLCYDNSIRLDIEMDEALAGLKISKMTLYPFVENSVVHGKIGGKMLNISVRIFQDRTGAAVFRIEDDGAGIPAETAESIERLNSRKKWPDGKYFGITNTIARLNFLYCWRPYFTI